jgi:hypothetical protein
MLPFLNRCRVSGDCFTRLLVAVIILLLLTIISVQAGEIYKWVDKDGNVHFSATPPDSLQSEVVGIQKPPAQDTESQAPMPYDGKDMKGQHVPSKEELRRRERVKETAKNLARVKEENRDPVKCAEQRALMARIKNADPALAAVNEYHPSYIKAETLANIYCSN